MNGCRIFDLTRKNILLVIDILDTNVILTYIKSQYVKQTCEITETFKTHSSSAYKPYVLSFNVTFECKGVKMYNVATYNSYKNELDAILDERKYNSHIICYIDIDNGNVYFEPDISKLSNTYFVWMLAIWLTTFIYYNI